MEQLDRVYQAFTTLDESFKKSTKTRSEFLRAKFGGDIEVGSAVILDAISTGNLTPEDIEKLTYLRELFDNIKKNIDRLDQMPDFNFSEYAEVAAFTKTLRACMEKRGNITRCTQRSLLKSKRVYNNCASIDGASYTDFMCAPVVHIGGPVMSTIFSKAYPTLKPVVDGFVNMTGHEPRMVRVGTAKRIIGAQKQ